MALNMYTKNDLILVRSWLIRNLEKEARLIKSARPGADIHLMSVFTSAPVGTRFLLLAGSGPQKGCCIGDLISWCDAQFWFLRAFSERYEYA